MLPAKGEKDKSQNRRGRTTGSIVAPDALDKLKRRAEEFGLIMHARQEQAGGRTQGRGKKRKR